MFTISNVKTFLTHIHHEKKDFICFMLQTLYKAQHGPISLHRGQRIKCMQTKCEKVESKVLGDAIAYHCQLVIRLQNVRVHAGQHQR